MISDASLDDCSTPTPVIPLRVDHVTLLVGSLERSMPYYDALLPLLGFTKKRDHVWTDGEGFFFQFPRAYDGMPAYQRYGIGMNHPGLCRARCRDRPSRP